MPIDIISAAPFPGPYNQTILERKAERDEITKAKAFDMDERRHTAQNNNNNNYILPLAHKFCLIDI